MLHDKAVGTGRDSAARIGGVLMHSQKHDLDGRLVSLELFEGVNASEIRHGNVRDYDVRRKGLCFRNEIASVFGDAYKVEVVRKKAPQPLAYNSMVVSNQHPRPLHALAFRYARRQNAGHRIGLPNSI